MMKAVYHVSDAILNALGDNSPSVFQSISAGKSGLKNVRFDNGSCYPAAALGEVQNIMLLKKYGKKYTRFEQMCLFAIEEALKSSKIEPASKDCIFILSTTKGNVKLIGDETSKSSVPLHVSAEKIGRYFNNPNKVNVVSVACISGVAAQVMAKRLLEADHFQHAIIVGCDELSDFVLAGFHSFQALSDEPCMPFDKDRKGLNLGEAAACLILSNDENYSANKAILKGAAISNDANHLSGPSKTGAELSKAISECLNEANIMPHTIDFVSAHGTATNYNDEMEAKAIYLSGIKAPINSLKPYFGHTLGASGLLETIMSLHAMEHNQLIPSLNFNESNVSVPVHIIQHKHNSKILTFVKTAAGFGGCNASVIWKKIL